MVCNFFFLLKWSATWKSLRSTTLNICVCVPECFITTRSQMAVHKAHWGAVKEKRNSYCSLISCNHQDKTNYSSLGLFSLATKYKGGEKRGKSRVSSLVSVLVCFKKRRFVPSVFPRPVFTLAVFTWLMHPSCSGFTNTASLIFQRDCTATYRRKHKTHSQSPLTIVTHSNVI